MVKALTFFDLDGTLLNAKTELDADVIQAIQQLKQNDILPVIATGRNLFEIRHIIDQTKIDTLVSANGTFVIANGKPIYSTPLDKAVIERLTTMTSTNGDAYAVLNHAAARIDRLTDVARNCYHYINTPVPIIDPTYWQFNPINMMLVLTLPENDDRYRTAFKNELAFYRQTPYSMDVVVPNGSKQTGIKQLLARPEYQGLPTYAFGDGNNDLSMFDVVDHAVAMGNADDHVKAAAEYVTTANVDHGIVNGLKHFDLIS